MTDSARQLLAAAQQRVAQAKQHAANLRSRARAGEPVDPLELVTADAEVTLAEAPLGNAEAAARAEGEAELVERRREAIERYEQDEAAAVDAFRATLADLRVALRSVQAAADAHEGVLRQARFDIDTLGGDSQTGALYQGGVLGRPAIRRRPLVSITTSGWVTAILGEARGQHVDDMRLYPKSPIG